MDQTRTGKEAETDLHRFAIGLARGLAGALLFALPMFMTMEMWSLGLYANRSRLLLLCVLNVPLLFVLARRIGFEKTISWEEAARDAVIAYGLGIVISTLMLGLFGILNDQVSTRNIVAKIAVQSVPASIGALLGRSQLGTRSEKEEENEGDYDGETGYFHELFMMAIGALFLSLNVAPTEEILLIAYKITPFHTLCLVILSISVMHGFVYTVHFKGAHGLSDRMVWWHSFVRFTMAGYVIALLTSAYALWTFEQIDSASLSQVLTGVVVLGVPAAIGAASARLIL
jgi:putative integral membrane protein (TIGR02587 family)